MIFRKILMYIGAFIVLTNFSSAAVFAANIHNDKEKGISFQLPDSFQLDKEASHTDPFSLVFSKGTPPFAISVQFRAVDGESMDAFLEKEYKEQDIGGYRDQVKVQRVELDDGLYAVELTRQTAMGSMYYYVFPAIKTKGLYAFWHMANDRLDSDQKGVEAFHMMKRTLKLSK